jgi:signal transduction histidine kinase
MDVKAVREGERLLIQISDDGIGFAEATVFGRGLTGMHERVRALSGTFQFRRESGRTYIRCDLPLGG